MFRNLTFQRTTASFILLAFSSLTLSPLARAQNQYNAVEEAGLLTNANRAVAAGNEKVPTSDERAAKLLADIHEDLKVAVPQVALGKNAHMSGKAKFIGHDLAAKAKNIRAKYGELKGLYASIEDGFGSTGQRLKDAKLPQEILNRHALAVGQYQDRRAEFDRLMIAVEQSPDQSSGQAAALAELASFMVRHPHAKPHQYTDPNKLPFGMADAKTRAPNTSKEQYQASLFPPQHNPILLAGPIPDGMQFTQTVLPTTPNAADLAQTDDVQITPAIHAQAALLNKNPVTIYNWVRNNISYIPSHGSIQGSEMTLESKRGNAIDTASLLIALYRASGIPARYVYGTIDIPATSAMNWVGGVSKPEAAQSLLGQGGIPNIGMTAGGVVQTIRMEHVWVQAYVDYIPSRGAVNKYPDTWVDLDASFKQYQFTKGMNINDKVPVDGATSLASIQQGATLNETQGYIQNVNLSNLQSQIASHQNQLEAYIDGQNAQATVRDVIGGQNIIAHNHVMLAGTLPYKTVAIGSRFQLVPDNLKWKFKTNIYAADGFSDGSAPIIEINRPTSTLAGKKITLSFAAATKADEDLIASYMPKPHLDGTPIQPHEFPTSLPGYLLRLKAELRVDGELVAQTPGSFTMGSEVRQSNQFYNPSRAAWDGGADNDIVVGEYNAIGMDLQGNGAQQLKKQQARMGATYSKLKQFEQRPNDTTLIDGLTKEDVAGDLLQAGILAYFAMVNASNAFDAGISGNMKSYRLPSYGRFYTSVQPSYWFGIPRNVGFPGMGIDVDYLFTQLESSNANAGDRADHMRRIGAESSAAEHTIPEILARNAALPAGHPAQPQGVSAVKALAVAAAQGQRIYALNSRNLALHSPILQSLAIDQDVKSEIANALASGKEVTVHEKNIAISGWTGSGYLILDPQTGAGAYKIAGGGNGGEVIFQGGAALFALTQIISLIFYGGAAIGLALVSGPVFIGITLLVAVVTLIAGLAADPDQLYKTTELTKRLAIILALVKLGALAFALSPFLFFFVFIALLLYIASIVMSELGFNPKKNRQDWRNAWA